MKIRDETLWRELIALFTRLNVRDGGQLLLEDLRQMWRDSGFRAEDLDRAIDTGAAQGLFERTDYEGQPCVVLRSRRIPRADHEEKPLLGPLIDRLAESAARARAKHRRRGSGGDSRRESDRDDPEAGS